VPAENFGRAFASWRDGHPSCFTKKGKKLTNRQCAEKVSPEFRRMFSDMYNLYAAIGSVNALRSNYNFQILPGEEPDFGSCEMIIDNKKAQQPEASRGISNIQLQKMSALEPRRLLLFREMRILQSKQSAVKYFELPIPWNKSNNV